MSSELTVVDDEDSRLGGLLDISPTASMAIQLAGVMVDKRIATARAYPRSISKFKKEATELLTEDIQTAMSAEYAKPVGNGFVRGPSVRLAELVAMCWTNLDVQVSEPVIGEKNITCMASAYDLQRNYTAPGMSSVSIIKRDGSRMPAAVIENLLLATAAKARRNAILAVIPRSYVQDLLEVAKAVASKNKKPLEQVRVELLDWYAKTHKVDAQQIYTLLGIAGVEEITQEHIDNLRGVAEAIREGAPASEFFAPPATNKIDSVKKKLDESRNKGKPAATEIPKPSEEQPVTPLKPETKPEPVKTVEPPKTAEDAPKGKVDLAALLDELDAIGGDSAAFLKKQGITLETLKGARAKLYDAYLRALRLAITQAEEAKKIGTAPVDTEALAN